jgi:hypothetical protein
MVYSAFLKKKTAQVTLEAVLVFVIIIAFLFGTITIWKKLNQNMVKQVQDYKGERQGRFQ